MEVRRNLFNYKYNKATRSDEGNCLSATLPPGRVFFPSTETTERPQPVLRSGSFPLSTFCPQSPIALNSLRSALVSPQPPRAAEYGRVSSRSYATLPVARHLHVRAPSRFLKASPPLRSERTNPGFFNTAGFYSRPHHAAARPQQSG